MGAPDAKSELLRFSETTGMKMFRALAAELKRKRSRFEEHIQEDVMITLINTALMPLIMLSRSRMFQHLGRDVFAQHIADQFKKLDSVVTNRPPPTFH